MVFQHTESTGLFGRHLCLQLGRADEVKMSCAAVNLIGREGRLSEGDKSRKKLLKAVWSELIHEEVLLVWLHEGKGIHCRQTMKY